jgi:hypothetical protein
VPPWWPRPAAKATGPSPPTSGGWPATVRGWLRHFAEKAGAIREHFTPWAHALGPGHDGRFAGGSAFCDAVEAIGRAGAVAVRRFGPRSPWLLASVLTAGRLLCNTSSPFPPPDLAARVVLLPDKREDLAP